MSPKRDIALVGSLALLNLIGTVAMIACALFAPKSLDGFFKRLGGVVKQLTDSPL